MSHVKIAPHLIRNKPKSNIIPTKPWPSGSGDHHEDDSSPQKIRPREPVAGEFQLLVEEMQKNRRRDGRMREGSRRPESSSTGIGSPAIRAWGSGGGKGASSIPARGCPWRSSRIKD